MHQAPPACALTGFEGLLDSLLQRGTFAMSGLAKRWHASRCTARQWLLTGLMPGKDLVLRRFDITGSKMNAATAWNTSEGCRAMWQGNQRLGSYALQAGCAQL